MKLIRFKIARWLISFGLFVMPRGMYRTGLINAMSDFETWCAFVLDAHDEAQHGDNAGTMI